MQILRTIAALFTAPTFDRRRSWAGSTAYTCRQTGEQYRVIPAGPVGFYVAGTGGRFVGQALNHSSAAELIEQDAREAMRCDRRLAA